MALKNGTTTQEYDRACRATQIAYRKALKSGWKDKLLAEFSVRVTEEVTLREMILTEKGAPKKELVGIAQKAWVDGGG